MIVILFLIGFLLGLSYALIGEKLPLLIPGIKEKEDNNGKKCLYTYSIL